MKDITAKYHSPREYLDAAKSIEATAAELRELAKTSWEFVGTAVASNPNTDSDVLSDLVPQIIESWADQERTAAIAQNPKTSSDTLSILATRVVPVLDNGRNHQVGFKAGVLLCSNPSTPFQAIKALLHNDKISMQFRKVLARETGRRDVLDLLSTDKSETVRRSAQKNIENLQKENGK